MSKKSTLQAAFDGAAPQVNYSYPAPLAVQPSPFEPGQVTAHVDPVEPPAQEQIAVPEKIPRALVLNEAIGWMEGGVLCQFREDQLVSNKVDIVRLMHNRAKYSELK